MEEFIDYYENQHSRLSERLGRSPSIPHAVRYVRRYLDAGTQSRHRRRNRSGLPLHHGDLVEQP